jgi:tRNA pseudouridine55 synthase
VGAIRADLLRVLLDFRRLRPTISFIMASFGILNVGKPAGPTSRDVVDHVERLVRPAKAGHAGTLDPLASGVLVICVGQATRLIQYVQRMPKTYRATFLLGKRSETDDIEAPLEDVPQATAPNRAELDAALSHFSGEIAQRPPAHSAVKLAGRRAYELARRGIDVQLQPRTVMIHRITLIRYAYPELSLEIECGSGTYIRALGRDLGEALGTGAVMSGLERTAIGKFRIDDALALDKITAESLTQHVQPALAALRDLPQVTLSEAQLIEVRHGRPILKAWLTDPASHAIATSELAAIDSEGGLAAILYEKLQGELWPRANFT